MMARPLSLDLRTRIAGALNGGMTVRAAERFGISAASAVRIGQLNRSGKGLLQAKIGGYVKPTLRGLRPMQCVSGCRSSQTGRCVPCRRT